MTSTETTETTSFTCRAGRVTVTPASDSQGKLITLINFQHMSLTDVMEMLSTTVAAANRLRRKYQQSRIELGPEESIGIDAPS